MPDAAARKTVHQAQQAGWLIVRRATDANLVSLLTVELHQGEADAIALALDMKVQQLLIDEKEGRAMARRLGVPVIGVLGVLLRGKTMGHVPAIKPEIEALRSHARFFIAPDLEAAILARAGE
jgi:predicted nucleic acid-binding protein